MIRGALVRGHGHGLRHAVSIRKRCCAHAQQSRVPEPTLQRDHELGNRVQWRGEVCIRVMLARSLANDEVYALTAYILSLNKLIGENETMNALTLPKVRMPSRDGLHHRFPGRL